MEPNIKKFFAVFCSLVCFLIICIAGIYAYFNPAEINFATAASVFAVVFLPFYYLFKGRKEPKQKHFIISILTMVFIPLILVIIAIYRWYTGLPSFPSAAAPWAAFVVVWVEAFIWFIAGIMIVIGSYHTDEIVEKIAKR